MKKLLGCLFFLFSIHSFATADIFYKNLINQTANKSIPETTLNKIYTNLAKTPPLDPQTYAWVEKVLPLQENIDLNVPLKDATFFGTHNSYNALAYANPVRYIAPNQLLSITDQLNEGARLIELDLHWYQSWTDFKDHILLCHATTVGKLQHFGCSHFDRRFREGLQEIRDWLNQPQNKNQVLIVYLEQHIDGHYSEAYNELNEYLGDKIYTPTMAETLENKLHHVIPLYQLPTTILTKNDVLQAGKNIIVVTKGSFPTTPPLVFSSSEGNLEDPLDAKIDDFRPYPDCGTSTTFKGDKNHLSMWRFFGDQAWFDALADGKAYPVSVKDLQQEMHCPINEPNVDMLAPRDARLLAYIWSWAQSYPLGDGQCSVFDPTKHGIVNVACHVYGKKDGLACFDNANQQWQVMPGVYSTFAAANSVCKKLGLDYHFAMPVNGSQMYQLSLKANGFDRIWLNYINNGQAWVANSN